MSLPIEKVLRVALILPKGRLREWHRQLAARLNRSCTVEIRLDDRKQPYAWSTQFWLTLEQSIFGHCPLVQPVPDDDNWPVVTSDATQDADVLVINLSECAWHHTGALELRYNGSLDSMALMSHLLMMKTPHLTVGRSGETGALASSYPAIEIKLSISRALQAAFARNISLIERALQSSTLTIDDGMGVTSVPKRDHLLLSGFILRTIAKRAARLLLKPFLRFDHWHVALRVASGKFTTIHDDGQRFYADPFLQRWRDRTLLFVEEYSYATGRGVISVAEVVGDRIPTAPAPVLTRPYHLSYPFVFAHDGERYMLPETGGNQSLELYCAVDFPWKWELAAVLMQGAVFSDATLLHHEGLWWLFSTVSAPGESTQDELSIFYSETLQGGWTPHPANPVKSDCRSSRPAGRIVRKDHRLFRPAQDCERTYGAGLVWLEIVELTPNRFSERQVAHWDGVAELGMSGLHSFDQLGQLQAIDFKRTTSRGLQRNRLQKIALRKGDALGMPVPASGAPHRQGTSTELRSQSG